MTSAIIPFILSGGTGSRLWPQSREQYPKQLLALTSDHTLIQESVLRVGDAMFGPAVIVCNDEQRFIIAEQMRAIDSLIPGGIASIIVEPVARNTAAAIAAAALSLEDKQALMLVAPADHLITDRAAFVAAVQRGVPAAREGKLVTFGMTPTTPETGYGYIKRGVGSEGVFAVAQFVEKPSRELAQTYLDSGEFFWNSGIFLFSAASFLAELEAYAPDIVHAVRAAVAGARRDLDFIRLDKEAFASSPSISIDYAVMEKTRHAVVVPASMGWTDIGSWSALWDVASKDENANAWLGDVILHNAAGCYVDSKDKLTAIVGLKDVVVVTTEDAVLVADKAQVQDVRKIVEQLKKDGRIEHIAHRRVYRPWGSYDTVYKADFCQVRHISVAPGGRVGLQKHAHRAEHWIIVRGHATVTKNGDTFVVVENQSVWIPPGAAHRLENLGAVTLDLIEVQSGVVLDEGDIERLESAY